MSDRNICSIPESAFLMGKHAATVRSWLTDDVEFAGAVVIPSPDQYRTELSVPRLCRYLHGAEADSILPEWYERLSTLRAQRRAS